MISIGISGVLSCIAGVFTGIVFGSIPGLTGTMAIALLLPVTFGMDTGTAFGLLLGIYCGSTYGGSITAILIKTPGTPAAACTVLDGHPLAVKGKAKEALSLAAIASFVGGVFSCAILFFVAPQLAKIAIEFGPAEYFAVGLFGLSIVGCLSANDVKKGAISALFGLMLSVIGVDPVAGVKRMTFNQVGLMNGIALIPALIGLFAMSEVFEKVSKAGRPQQRIDIKGLSGGIVSLKVLKENAINILRSSAIGTVIGIIPGTGSAVSPWIAYSEAKRVSKQPNEFGKGCYAGVAAAESANNGVTGGALVPLLTLGIPGDAVTAILLGALMIQGLTPGPLLFVEHADVVHQIYLLLIISNLFMLIFGLAGVPVFVKVLKVKTEYLMPVVISLCFIGGFAINNSVTDMMVLLLLGIAGYFMVRGGFPIPPAILGIILGGTVESNFRRALTMSRGSYSVFLTPICVTFICISFATFFAPAVLGIIRKKKSKKNAKNS